MDALTSTLSPTGKIMRWIINIVWIAVWTVLFFLCIKVFGDTTALVGVLLLVVLGIAIWLLTERHNLDRGEEEQ